MWETNVKVCQMARSTMLVAKKTTCIHPFYFEALQAGAYFVMLSQKVCTDASILGLAVAFGWISLDGHCRPQNALLAHAITSRVL